MKHFRQRSSEQPNDSWVTSCITLRIIQLQMYIAVNKTRRVVMCNDRCEDCQDCCGARTERQKCSMVTRECVRLPSILLLFPPPGHHVELSAGDWRQAVTRKWAELDVRHQPSPPATLTSHKYLQHTPHLSEYYSRRQCSVLLLICTNWRSTYILYLQNTSSHVNTLSRVRRWYLFRLGWFTFLSKMTSRFEILCFIDFLQRLKSQFI